MKHSLRTIFMVALFSFLIAGIVGCKKEDTNNNNNTSHCSNGVMDGDEAGIDCGGSCTACQQSGNCSDGIKNNAETGMDCGGSSCSACQYYFTGSFGGTNIDIGYKNYMYPTDGDSYGSQGSFCNYTHSMEDRESSSESITLYCGTTTSCTGPGMDINTWRTAMGSTNVFFSNYTGWYMILHYNGVAYDSRGDQTGSSISVTTGTVHSLVNDPSSHYFDITGTVSCKFYPNGGGSAVQLTNGQFKILVKDFN